MKVLMRAHEVGDADIDVLGSHGFSQDDIWDITTIAPSSACPAGWQT
jgi:hypothetical protein